MVISRDRTLFSITFGFVTARLERFSMNAFVCLCGAVTRVNFSAPYNTVITTEL